MRRSLIAVPVAAGLAFGGASLATADDPPAAAAVKAKRLRAIREMPAPMFVRGGFLPGAIGIDQTLGEDLAKELGLETKQVDAALRRVLANRLDAHRDKVLACFDDPAKCGGLERPEIAIPKPMFP
jgi:hypothetical protein